MQQRYRRVRPRKCTLMKCTAWIISVTWKCPMLPSWLTRGACCTLKTLGERSGKNQYRLTIHTSLHLRKQVLYHSLFSDPFTIRICAYILMLPRFFSSALARLQKFVQVDYFLSCAFALIMKPINFYSSSYLLHLYISLKELTELIRFLFNCLISSFRSAVAPPQISYNWSICSLVFRWRKSCVAKFRFWVKNRSRLLQLM